MGWDGGMGVGTRSWWPKWRYGGLDRAYLAAYTYVLIRLPHTYAKPRKKRRGQKEVCMYDVCMGYPFLIGISLYGVSSEI